MRRVFQFCFVSLWASSVIALAPGAVFAQNPCEVPDNGSGTVTLPPIGCEYISPFDVFRITEGLPPGTTIGAPSTPAAREPNLHRAGRRSVRRLH